MPQPQPQPVPVPVPVLEQKQEQGQELSTVLVLVLVLALEARPQATSAYHGDRSPAPKRLNEARKQHHRHPQRPRNHLNTKCNRKGVRTR